MTIICLFFGFADSQAVTATKRCTTFGRFNAPSSRSAVVCHCRRAHLETCFRTRLTALPCQLADNAHGSACLAYGIRVRCIRTVPFTARTIHRRTGRTAPFTGHELGFVRPGSQCDLCHVSSRPSEQRKARSHDKTLNIGLIRRHNPTSRLKSWHRRMPQLLRRGTIASKIGLGGRQANSVHIVKDVAISCHETCELYFLKRRF